jgi:hypothetical protein
MENATIILNRLIKWAAIILLFLLLLSIGFDRIKVNPRSIIWSDAEGYYDYLPGLFILKDFHKLPPGSMWPYYNDRGEFVNKFTCGVAYFEFPFFASGYLINRLMKNNPDDYSNDLYARSIAFGGVFISFLGLIFLYKSMVRDD